MAESMEQQAGGRVPVVECFRQAWQFLAGNWRLMLSAAAITAVLSQAGVALVLMMRGPPDGSQTMLTVTLWDMAAAAPAIVAGLLFYAVVLRKAIRGEFLGPTGLAFGADEVRLLGVTAALACVILPILALLFIVVFFVVLGRLANSPEQLAALMEDQEALAAALERSLGQTGMLAFVLFVMIVTAMILYISVRLVMINAATIGERRIVIFQTWSWSRGNILRMLGAVVLTALPVFLIDSFLDTIRLSLLETAPGGAGAAPALLVVVNAAMGFVMAIVSIPTIVLGAILYKGLRPRDFVAK